MACVKLTTKAQLKLDANYSCTVSVILKNKIMLLASPTSRWMVVQKRQITEKVERAVISHLISALRSLHKRGNPRSRVPAAALPRPGLC